MLHLLDSEATLLETSQSIDPRDAPLIEDAAVVLVSLNSRHESGIAVELQCFIVHAGQFACLLHRIGLHARMG